jgi:hypothetical protein
MPCRAPKKRRTAEEDLECKGKEEEGTKNGDGDKETTCYGEHPSQMDINTTNNASEGADSLTPDPQATAKQNLHLTGLFPVENGSALRAL